MINLIIIFVGGSIVALAFLLWMKYTKSGNKWVDNL